MSKSQKRIIVGIGEVLWDIYREKRYLGGAPANVAIHASQLGEQGATVSRIGNDGLGNELVRAFEKKGLVSNYLQIDKKKGTGTVIIRLDVHGMPSFLCNEDVAFDYLQFTPELEELARKADAVVFGTLAQRAEISRNTILQFLEKCQGIRVFDLNARNAGTGFAEIVSNALQYTDILKVSDDEIRLIMKIFRREGEKLTAFTRWLIEQYQLQCVALTQGAKGAAIITLDQALTASGYKIQPLDTTGAGDAFTAGLLSQYLSGKPLQESLGFANKMAAYVCLHRGATPKLSQKAIERFIQNIEMRSE
ncbi:MAG: carbohydrate kinase [bacterium]